jgi:oligoribonuclease NrnB/cAMP/cGMP phosphodiesterase (DHH superfamily)
VITKNIHVFTDVDLDGAASLLLVHWALKVKLGDIKFTPVTVSNFRKEFLKWLEEDSFDNYDNVVFLDLDTSNCVDLIDHPKAIVIDHHLTHVNVKDKYKRAVVTIIEAPSCAKLIYKTFKDKNYLSDLSDKQKYLIALANDYDSYQFKLEETYDLNCAFSNTQRTLEKGRTHKFVERFYNGFDGLNQFEKNIVNEFKTGRDLTIKNLQVYSGRVSISKQELIVTGTTGSKYVNDVCDHLLKTYNSDIVFFVNANNSHVSFRKKKECTVDMSKLAAKLCEGGGHEYAAGGKITETFMEFVKQLTPVGT